LERRDHRRRESDHAGRSEYGDLQSAQLTLFFFLQEFLHAHHHRGGRGEGPSGIGKQRDRERRHHRLLGGGQHIERDDRILSAQEHGRARAAFRRPGKHRVLHQPRDFLERHVGVGEHRVVAGVERHVHVEWAHMLERRHHVKNLLVGHRSPNLSGGRRVA
jgi:hypothetical protein